MIGNSYVLKILNTWCNIVYWHAAHLITLSPGMREELIARGVRSDRVSVIYNWCDESHIMPTPRDDRLASELGLSGDFVVMYAGNMGLMQGLNTILEAAQSLANKEPKIKFVFVGGGVEKERLETIAANRKLSNVVFLNRQPLSAMGRILALADVLLVHLKDTPLFRITLPQKIQAYLAAGKPILLGVRGDGAEIIRNSGAGMIAEPENPASIVEKLLELFRLSEGERRQMGIRGRSYYEKVMSISVGVGRFEEVFNKMLANRA
jgi:glycosyltransferase involved in cell wall biosynthesis